MVFFLLLTFSKKTQQDFVKKAKILFAQKKSFINDKNVKTFSALSRHIIKVLLKNKRIDSIEVGIYIVYANRLLKNKLNWKKIKADIVFNDLKCIFVDEAQDISETDWNLLLNLKKILLCKLILIGDPNQNIYQFRRGSDKYLREYNYKEFNLINNYRCSENIVKIINHIKPWNKNKLMISKSNSLIQTLPLLFIGNEKEIVKNIIDDIIKSEINLEEIAIIGPVKKSKPILDTFYNIGLSMIIKSLEKNNIKYIKHYKDNDDRGSISKFNSKKGHVNLLTSHSSKGLEFEKIYVINFHFQTFGINPTIEEYNRFKYLWYVTLSRAKNYLQIYAYDKKQIWPDIISLKKNFNIKNNNKEYLFNPSKNYRIDKTLQSKNITEITKDIQDEDYLKFSDLLKKSQENKKIEYMSTTKALIQEKVPIILSKWQNLVNFLFNKKIFDTYEIKEFSKHNNSWQKSNILNFNKYAPLFGIYIEYIFKYFYYYFKNSELGIKYFKYILELEKESIILPETFIKSYKSLNYKIINVSHENKYKTKWNLNLLSNYKNIFNSSEKKLYEYLISNYGNYYKNDFFVILPNSLFTYPKKEICNILNEIILNFGNQQKIEDSLFSYSLIKYAFDIEEKHLLKKDFTKEKRTLLKTINQIKEFAKKNKNTYLFDQEVFSDNIDTGGIIDILDLGNKEIIEIKFSQKITEKYILQTLLYNLLKFPKENIYKIEIWNFYNGEIINYELNLRETKFKLLILLSKIIDKKLKNMVFLYDLETTGLNVKECKIIDVCFLNMNFNTISINNLIKPCEYIPPNITELTKITNEMTNKYGKNIDWLQKQVGIILENCEKPIFIAHNGKNFDEKILENVQIFPYQKNRNNNLYKTLGSEKILKLWLNNEGENKWNLDHFYQKTFNEPRSNSHRAKSDVIALYEIFKKLSLDENYFINF